MTGEAALELSPEEARETPMIDLVYEFLHNTGDPLNFADMVKRVAEIKGLSEGEMRGYMPQLYTEINIDGRFICVGRSLWGLKTWYTVEQGSDAAVAQNVKDDDDDYFLDDEKAVDGDKQVAEDEEEEIAEDDDLFEEKDLDDAELDDESF